MELSPYLEGLRRDLASAAAPGGPEVARAADLLSGSLEASARLCLLEALSDAAAEITTKLRRATVDVQLRGREAHLVVTETEPASQAEPASPPQAGADAAESGDLARMTLRLPESLKEAIERAAAAEAISVNAWLVRALSSVVAGGPPRPGPGSPPPGRGRLGRRVTGYAQS